jgi:hypothetical protein
LFGAPLRLEEHHITRPQLVYVLVVPCLVALILLGSPRLAFVALALFGHGYLGRAVDSGLLLVLGFFFMPITTMSFAYATNSLGPVGQVNDLGWVLIAVSALFDLGFIGGGAKARRRR